MQVKMGPGEVSGKVSVLCGMPYPLQTFTVPEFGKKVKLGNKVQFGKKFTT